MKIKTIFVTIILGILLTSSKVYATENRITEEELQASSNIEATEVNRETAVMLLSATEGTATVIETWDISATEEDNITATLYDNGNLIIEGTGNMKDLLNYGDIPWYNDRSNIISAEIKSGVTSIGISAFENCNNLANIEIPNGVTKIGGDAFACCRSLTSIELPTSVTNIGNSAFYDCDNLKNIILSTELIRIENGAFYGCSSLTSIEIPEKVTSIGNGAFQNCSNLTNITIPNGVTSINSLTFNGCSSLTTITIPQNVTTIGDNAFRGCSSLKSINIYCSNKYAKQYVIENYPELLNIIHISGCEETKEELQITTTYKLKEKDNIKRIILTPNTSVREMLNNITSNKEIKIVSKSGEEIKANVLVGTGAKVITKEDNKEIYTVVVKGDVNGDGLVKPIDVTTANSIRLNKVKFSYEELLASDIDENEKVNPIDITKINSYRLGKINSL